MNQSHAMVLLPELDDSELPELRAFAEAIWLEAYLDLIGEAQIRYMMDLLYDPARLREERRREGRRLRWIVKDGRRVGYLGHDRPGKGRETALHKFYLAAAHRGSGVATTAIERLASEAAAAGSTAFTLRVNRGNARAIRFYEKAGFRFNGEHCLDIGGGFVMDDYLMRRDLEGSADLQGTDGEPR